MLSGKGYGCPADCEEFASCSVSQRVAVVTRGERFALSRIYATECSNDALDLALRVRHGPAILACFEDPIRRVGRCAPARRGGSGLPRGTLPGVCRSDRLAAAVRARARTD